MMKHTLFPILGVLSVSPAFSKADNRPNFVWLMGEDTAPQFMGMYNDSKGAKTPNMEYLAQNGIVFENAYSNAPVSSAARSTLITGCYAPKFGISFHRKLELLNMPENFHMFPTYLRRAGYCTANSSKTDYNCVLDTCAWDMIKSNLGDWRKRKDKNQPFFFVRTNAASHESCLHFSENQMAERKTVHDVNSVNILPVHPDTPLFRYTYATFYDKIQKVDNELGKMIEMLLEDGVLDNTFIFYFGDNGGSLPGSKGYTGETGLKVPMIVYVPQKWREKLPVNCGGKVHGFVSFMDLGPTLLHLAGLNVPEHMDGTPFMGEDISLDDMNGRDLVYGYGDRFDELYAFNRTVRKGNFKYSRNFQPYHSKSLFAFYRYKQLAFKEWRKLYEEGKLNDVQSYFFRPQGTEELYDLSNDPYETKNLASLPEYKGKLKEMRGLLDKNMTEQCDLGLLPECVWLEEGRKNPYEYGRKSQSRLKSVKNVVDMQLESFGDILSALKKSLESEDPVERWWAVTVCASFGKEAEGLKGMVEKMLADDASYIRSRAMVFLSMLGREFTKYDLMKVFGTIDVDSESLLVMNDIAFMVETGLMKPFPLTMKELPCKCNGIDWRVDYMNMLYKKSSMN